jgi:NitT/TauT family transport system permease protein
MTGARRRTADWAGMARRLITPVALIVAWQLAVTFVHFGDGFVPAPTEVVQVLWDWIFGHASGDRYSGTWAPAVEASFARVLGGFLVAAVAGVIVGMLIGRSRILSDLLDPLVQLLRPIPVSAWVPFSLIFFGIGGGAAISLVALGAFFPVVLNTAAGARQVSFLHMRSARMLGAGTWRTVLLVVLPSALPSIMVGLRLAMGLSWVLLIVAEMVAVKSGLGYELWNAYYYSRMDVIVAAMLTIGIFGYLSDRVILTLAARILRWQSVEDL